MKAIDTPDTDNAATTCFFCGKAIVDGHWFARINQGSRRVIFCRPHCVEEFLDQAAALRAGSTSGAGRNARHGA